MRRWGEVYRGMLHEHPEVEELILLPDHRKPPQITSSFPRSASPFPLTPPPCNNHLTTLMPSASCSLQCVSPSQASTSARSGAAPQAQAPTVNQTEIQNAEVNSKRLWEVQNQGRGDVVADKAERCRAMQTHPGTWPRGVPPSIRNSAQQCIYCNSDCVP